MIAFIVLIAVTVVVAMWACCKAASDADDKSGYD